MVLKIKPKPRTAAPLTSLMWLLWCIVLCGAPLLSGALDPTVKTPIGTFEGSAEGNLVKFLGIRYGTPPLGELRFQPSSLYSSNATQYIIAKSYGPACWQQPAKENMSEDCLYLNIFMPVNNSSSRLLPVMFWIHGGGFLIGSGADYQVQELAALGQVIVSINYRLGPFGLLSSPILAAQTGYSGGINSVADQIVALNWVQQFIGYFGGDAQRITVFGESAGGVSSGILLITPALHAAPVQYFTVQSGPLFGLTPLDLKQGYTFSSTACRVAGYGACDLALLRAAPPQQLMQDLLQAGLQVMKRPPSPFGCWLWSVDGAVLPELPRDMLRQIGTRYSLNGQAVITGFVSMDGVISPPLNSGVPPLPSTPQQYQAYLTAYFGANPAQVRLLNTTLYPLAAFNNDSAQAWTQMNADACWVCPTLGLNRAIETRVTLYTFEFFGANAPLYLSAHGGDVYYLFNMTHWAKYFDAGWDATLSAQMQRAWTSFAVSGVPDLGNGITWQPFTERESVAVLKAGDTHVLADFPRRHHANACDAFWLDQQQVTPAMLLQMCWEYPAPAWPRAEQ